MPAWRQMRVDDLDAVIAIAALVHPDYPEDDAVLAERLTLYPEGCLLLEDGRRALGYFLSHPYPFGDVPKLNALLGTLPDAGGTYYLHDIALLPVARGQGVAVSAVALLNRHAGKAGFERLALTAVNGSAPFWIRNGFAPVKEPALAALLESYDKEAVYMSRPVRREG